MSRSGGSTAASASTVRYADEDGEHRRRRRERPGERHRTANVPDGRIDHASLQASLHRPRNMTMDRERVAVAAAHHDRPDDRVLGRLNPRLGPLTPFEPTLRDQVQLTHGRAEYDRHHARAETSMREAPSHTRYGWSTAGHRNPHAARRYCF